MRGEAEDGKKNTTGKMNKAKMMREERKAGKEEIR